MLDREEDGLLASVSEIAAARTSETEKSKEEHAGPRRNDERGAAERAQWRRRRRREKRGERRWRYAAQPWEPTAERASRAFHLASSSRPRLPPLSFSIFLLLSRTVRRSLFLRLFLSPPAYPADLLVRPASRTSLILLLFSSFARGRAITGRARFPSSLGILSISSLSSVHSPPPRPSPPSLPLDPRLVATGASVHIPAHTHTQIHTGAHIVPAENRAFFRARPRFLADFIPIPRNKLADDHGGICLPGNLSSPSTRPSSPDLLHHREQSRLFPPPLFLLHREMQQHPLVRA